MGFKPVNRREALLVHKLNNRGTVYSPLICLPGCCNTRVEKPYIVGKLIKSSTSLINVVTISAFGWKLVHSFLLDLFKYIDVDYVKIEVNTSVFCSITHLELF